MSAWRTAKMADVMREFYDGPHATPPPAGDGPVYLGIKNITDAGLLDLTAVRYIAETDFRRWTKRVTPREGDIVFTYEATLHRYALIPEGFRGCLGRRLALIRPDESVVSPRFLHFAMMGPEWRATVTERIISGSTVDRIPILTFPDFPISIPSLDVQERIGDVLGAIDDLIKNNQRRVEVLEEMARRVYREWFVHFRYPGHENVPLVDSSLGPIPDRWGIDAVSEVTEVVTRGVAPKYSEDGDWTVINQKCIRDERLTLDKARRQGRAVPVAKQVRMGDVLINSTGVGTLGRAALCLLEHPSLTVDTHVTIVRPSLPRANPWFGLDLIGRRAEFEQLSTGSTGQTELSRSDIGALQMMVPPESLRGSFADSVWPLLKSTKMLLDLNQSLAALRDILLPKLVTGEIDVSHLDLDALTEAAIA